MIKNIDIAQYIIIVLGYLITIATSGLVFRWIIGNPRNRSTENAGSTSISQNAIDLGAIMGKCENFITLSFILANQITGIAIIFSAKSIVRMEDIKRDSRFYLGGTLVNFSYSLFMGILIRTILKITGHPI
jgi:hypothetical protein